MPVTIFASHTPNPNAMKFTLDRQVAPGASRTVASPADAQSDPLGASLISIRGVRTVFFLNDFITITRDDNADWQQIQAAVEGAISSHFASS